MFQGMFRKRGRPPEQLPIGGHDRPNEDIPVHQSLEAPRQLPLPSVREFEQDVVIQPENDAGNNLSVQPFSTQIDNISNSQDRRLALNPIQVMSPNQAIPRENQESRLMCHTFLFRKRKEMRYSVKRVPACTVNFVGLKVLYYNKTTSSNR